MHLRLALRSLLHRPGRSLLSVLGVGLASGVFLSLVGVREGYRRSVEQGIDGLGAHLVVCAPGCPYEAATVLMRGGTGVRYIEAERLEELRRDARVAVAAPQLMQPALESDFDRLGGTAAGIALLLGVDASHFELRPWLRFAEGAFPEAPDAQEVVLGAEAARVLARRAGDPYLVPGRGETFRVAGVLEPTGTQDDGAVLVPLATLARLYGLEGRLTAVAVRLRDVADAEAVVADLQRGSEIQVIRLAQVRAAILSMTAGAQSVLLWLGGLAGAVALLGVSSTVLASVLERRRVFAMLRAMGGTWRTVACLLAVETTLLAAAGGVLGVVLAATAGPLFVALTTGFLPFAPGDVPLVLEPSQVAAVVPACVLLSLLAASVPAWNAARTPPLAALREQGT